MGINAVAVRPGSIGKGGDGHRREERSDGDGGENSDHEGQTRAVAPSVRPPRDGGLRVCRYVQTMDLEEILAVLHGWLGLEIEVSAHGGHGEAPISAVSARGRLRTGDVLSRPGKPEVFLFVLIDAGGEQVGSFGLDAEAFGGGGWLDEGEEVLEIESGVVQLLIATAAGDASPESR